MGVGPDQLASDKATGSGRVRRSGALRALASLSSGHPAPTSSPAAQAASVNPRRAQAARQARHVQEARRGRPQAMRHGAFAVLANRPDVATEVALQVALRPGLDLLRDARLVESFALASVQLRKASEAIEAEGLTPTLTSFVARQSMLVERLERAMHERERERLAGKAAGVDLLERYRSGGGA